MIGAQNVFVLRQALLRRHVLPVVLFCAFADAALATLGAVGLGAAVRGSEIALRVIAFGGAAFLFWYGLKAVARAIHPGRLEAANGGTASLPKPPTAVAAVTLLNPHVYLDTVVLVGGIRRAIRRTSRSGSSSASWPPASPGSSCSAMAGGAVAAVRNPSAWRVFDIGVAAIMWLIAARLTVLGASPQAF